MINSVRNTVLSVLNKNNYGYISPSDFNLFATQAQLEIFEEYFDKYNKAINFENARAYGSDYADIKKTISEVMEGFLRSDYLYPKFLFPSPPLGEITNFYSLPSESTTGFPSYMINKIVYYKRRLATGTNTSSGGLVLIDNTANFVAAGVSVRDIVFNVTNKTKANVVGVTPTTLSLDTNIFSLGSGQRYNVYSWNDYSEAEYVSNSKIELLSNSNLTSPSFDYPAYAIIGSELAMYPIASPTNTNVYFYGAVRADYFRYPKPPKWTFTTLSGGEPVFNQSQPDYQDFELPIEDEYKLVMKICQYSGVSIREAEVVQYAMAQEQQQNQ